MIQRKKYGFIITTILCLLFILMGCSDLSETPNSNKVSNNKEVTKFYPTISKATANNTFSEPLNKEKIGEQILTLKDDKTQINFFKSTYNNQDTVTVYKYQLRQDAGRLLYSSPTNATQIIWHAQLDSQKKAKLSNIDEIRLALKMNNPRQTFNLNPNATSLQWGISKEASTPSLTIDGQVPTKVIPITLDGDNVYFWYFENLVSPKNADSMKISF
ncbi:hypothetical protein [Listeria booriae]|uniref:Lipoprotein n=1 Tax=Listeria booriae TaxID=1552123 RepID=A0A7X1CB01_9LIST|nr:hypothetical protein [Listeria booriae]MBC1490936.1 hypothetical protein [Listeria booriae]MBC1491149.1 hypothetical protein [Listeria booriae]MBC2258909.1 hypothetical protein [Listeria booriae]MBC6151019.1 hypothetical protein [Listeria booriae]MBC6151232.1 hypothetical protein [Listeria booriae]